jgi:F-type H+-transporting ATPase subunit delta
MTNAQEYARALFMITEEDSVSDKVCADVKTVATVIKENPDYIKLISSPAISKDEMCELLDKAFSSLDWRLLNLIKILSEKRAMMAFDKIASAYSDLYDESRGIKRVEAVSAVPLTKEQILAIEQKLHIQVGGRFILTNTVDPSILGGIKLRYSGIQLDGSVKTRLDKFEEALKSKVI